MKKSVVGWLFTLILARRPRQESLTPKRLSMNQLAPRARGFLVAMLAFVAGVTFAAESKPVLVERVAPVYPEELRAQRVIGLAQVICLVDVHGVPQEIQVASQSHPAFGEAARAALARCRFRSGTLGDKPVAMRAGMSYEFTFTDQELAKLEAARTPESLPPGPPTVEAFMVSDMPVLKKEPRPEIPPDLKKGQGVENAVVRLIVDEQGLPRDVHLLVTTAAGCGPAAVEAAKKWRFKPGKKEGQVVRVAMEVPIAFFRDNSWASGARICPGVSRDIVESLPGATLVTYSGAPGQKLPKVVREEELDYPEEMPGLAIGGVTVECIINPYGVVTHARALDTSNPYFAIAAERCFSRWRFSPPIIDGKPVYLRCRQRAVFMVK